MKDNIYSVTEVNKYIKNMMEQDFFLSKVSIRGEISNLKRHSSGHIYLTIKDDGAALPAVIFASYARCITVDLKEGMKVVVTGNVDIYEKTGNCQIYIKTVEDDGIGILYKKYQELKERLEDSGMFDPMYKKPIPKYVKKVGIVTSPTGAAIQDIINISTRRNPYVQLILAPALVQGEDAAKSIAEGIRRLNETDVDVIIVGRGGGSLEDLWAFNEEVVADAIFKSAIPIISAVGHETDFTIADFVSDLRAPTPSAAAELSVYSIEELEKELLGQSDRLKALIDGKLERVKRISAQYSEVLEKLSPKNMILQRKHDAARAADRLEILIKDKLNDRRNSLKILVTKLDGLSPLKKLSEGYAVVETKGHVITGIDAVDIGDEISVHLFDGDISANVSGKHKEKR